MKNNWEVTEWLLKQRITHGAFADQNQEILQAQNGCQLGKVSMEELLLNLIMFDLFMGLESCWNMQISLAFEKHNKK